MKELIGLKVVVLSPDRKEILGDGEVINLTELIMECEGFEIVVNHNHPVIRLNDGSELTGAECWWVPKPCNDNPDFPCKGCIFKGNGCSEVKDELYGLHSRVSYRYTASTWI